MKKNDDDDDDDDDADEEDEESSEYASSADSASNAGITDQSATPRSCRRRHGENLNSDEDETPKRKRSKSDMDSGKMQSRGGSELTKDVASKEADSENKMLDTEITALNEPGQPTTEHEQVSTSASLQDNIPALQASNICTNIQS